MRKWLGRGSAVLLFMVIVIIAAGWAWLRTSLPIIEGSLNLPGLQAKTEIGRDQFGIPHIKASSEHDAYYALGVAHAQDRLWQMDFQRRLGAGRLSEILGGPTLDTDKYMRTLGLYQKAKASFQHLDKNTRAALTAYTKGVNAWLTEHRNSWSRAWPVEFYLLRYRPEPWTVADSLVWGRMMAIFLSQNSRTEILRAQLLKTLKQADVEMLLPPYPSDGPRSFATLFGNVPSALAVSSASNSWVLSGTRTAAGKPMLANDPHLRFRTPALWYLASITTPERTLSGATVPGLPFTVLGQNGKIAWGVTAAETDVQDLFVETLNPEDLGQYQTPDGYQPFTSITEHIGVKGKPDVTLKIRITRHGPILSDHNPALARLAGPGKVMTIQTPAIDPIDKTAAALYGINHAKDWASFRTALRDWHAPHMNISYADQAGNIGLIAPGRVPIRKQGSGLVPADGSTSDADWQGYIPFDELPQLYNPSSGKIANANNPVPTASYRYPLGNYRAPGYRAKRIDQQLDKTKPKTMDDMSRLQQDAVSAMAQELLPLMLKQTPRAPEIAAMLDQLSRWDHRMAREAAEPLIFLTWLRELNRQLFRDELGKTFGAYWGLRPLTIKRVLSGEAKWCDDTTTEPLESCGGMLARALGTALKSLSDTYGADQASWKWGAAHFAKLDHPVLGRVPVIGSLFNIRLPSDGGPYTINRGNTLIRNPGNPFASVHGAAYRGIYDLDDPSKSRYIIAPGQSGNWFSPHYKDLAKRWRDGGALMMQKGSEKLELIPTRSR
ncbi:MAG: penicillin acylase family protein [Alphaproteobacteria bacterium]|nr:penicillin acylase family protein [Alphaproteobacteria bacterium]